MEESRIEPKKLEKQEFQRIIGEIFMWNPEYAKSIEAHLLAVEDELAALNNNADLFPQDLTLLRGMVRYFEKSKDPAENRWGKIVDRAVKWIERESKATLLRKGKNE